jgi:hypothetical protein
VEDPWGSGSSLYAEPTTLQYVLPASLNDAAVSPSLATPRFFEVAEDPLVRAVVDDSHLSKEGKSAQLQSLFSRAASNGDIRCVRSMLQGSAREFIDINEEDEEGITPLIHAACFGHADVVRACASPIHFPCVCANGQCWMRVLKSTNRTDGNGRLSCGLRRIHSLRL